MVKNSQKWLKCSKWSKMVQNDPKWFKMVQNGQNCQKLSKLVKIVQMVQNGPKWSQTVPNGPNGQKFTNIVQNFNTYILVQWWVANTSTNNSPIYHINISIISY